MYFEALARESQTPATTTGQIWSWDPATAVAQPMSGISREGGGVALFYVDRGQLFWSANGLMATDLSTGNAHALDAAGPISFIGLDATNLYAEEGICPGSCPFTVWAVPRDGTARFIAYQTKAAYFTNGLTADDSGLYWVDWTSKALYHTTLDASSPDALARFGNLLPGQFALDATNVYWLDANGTGASQQVMAVPK